MVNLKELAMKTLAMKENKEEVDAIKEQLRSGARTSYNEYASITFKDSTTSSFKPEDQLKIDQFCKENGIEKVKVTKRGYSVTITPTPKAIAEYQRQKMNKNAVLSKAASKTKHPKK